MASYRISGVATITMDGKTYVLEGGSLSLFNDLAKRAVDSCGAITFSFDAVGGGIDELWSWAAAAYLPPPRAKRRAQWKDEQSRYGRIRGKR